MTTSEKRLLEHIEELIEVADECDEGDALTSGFRMALRYLLERLLDDAEWDIYDFEEPYEARIKELQEMLSATASIEITPRPNVG